jgi:hypothetical protein
LPLLADLSGGGVDQPAEEEQFGGRLVLDGERNGRSTIRSAGESIRRLVSRITTAVAALPPRSSTAANALWNTRLTNSSGTAAGSPTTRDQP